MNEQTRRIRDALATLPERFTTADAFAVCPAEPRIKVTDALAKAINAGELADVGKTLVTLAINGAGACGRHRTMWVRSFVRVKAAANGAHALDIPVFCTPGVHAVPLRRPGHHTEWDDGAKVLADALAAWPGSPAPALEEYA